ncbi:hypothetical protein [Roseateles sp. MS654]|uniref:hypothetical protein n=1 Tax=Roseateles sp. MS654 TaxID=3412685 RepID=UPI003C307F72
MLATTRHAQPSSSRFVRAAFGVLFAAVTVGVQAAPDDLKRVEVSGRRPGEIARTDVHAACPGIARTLADRLAVAQYRTGIEGTSIVSFRVNGNVVSEVRQNRGAWEYSGPVRRAFQSLECQGAARDTLYVVQIDFRNEPSADGTAQRFALTELPPTSAGSASLAASAAADGR